MSLTESDVQKRVIASFIDRNPSYVTFNRTEMVPDGAGGRVPSDPIVVNAQKVRSAGQPRQRTIVTEDGRQVVVDLALVALHDLDVQIGDQFVFHGQAFEVLNIQDSPSWRLIVESKRLMGNEAASVIDVGAFSYGFDQEAFA